MEMGFNGPPTGMAQPGMPTHTPHMGGGQSGMQKLQSYHGVYIKEKADFLEAATGCERENKYVIYALDEHNKKVKPKRFKAKEKSSFFSRQCVPGTCREFMIKIYNMDKDHHSHKNKETNMFLLLEKPYTMTCYCLNRPELIVKHSETGTDQVIGKIVHEFTCFNPTLKIYDGQNVHKYTIESDCTQLGWWCKCPLEPCEKIQWEVKNSSGGHVSRLTKKNPGFMKAALTDVLPFLGF